MIYCPPNIEKMLAFGWITATADMNQSIRITRVGRGSLTVRVCESQAQSGSENGMGSVEVMIQSDNHQMVP